MKISFLQPPRPLFNALQATPAQVQKRLQELGVEPAGSARPLEVDLRPDPAFPPQRVPIPPLETTLPAFLTLESVDRLALALANAAGGEGDLCHGFTTDEEED